MVHYGAANYYSDDDNESFVSDGSVESEVPELKAPKTPSPIPHSAQKRKANFDEPNKEKKFKKWIADMEEEQAAADGSDDSITVGRPTMRDGPAKVSEPEMLDIGSSTNANHKVAKKSNKPEEAVAAAKEELKMIPIHHEPPSGTIPIDREAQFSDMYYSLGDVERKVAKLDGLWSQVAKLNELKGEISKLKALVTEKLEKPAVVEETQLPMRKITTTTVFFAFGDRKKISTREDVIYQEGSGEA
ncbi:hypothetical protein K402DRAFT_451001 [Aulographum hederae CBS 113979]|uniref:Uncharacterized protein n=1 Tax=Aulographum hederae CBS 113979 TaxID=1176131 RepID=A0A6G1HBZ1_9PEZI|nr:hypothetical protein K402DRAFT_451001 [Aulographum hederae CBS 113979]